MNFFDYKIPEDILSKIPPYFWAAFAGELVSVFAPDILIKDEDDPDYSVLDYVTGTAGWNVALECTCHKLNMDWLYEYYSNLVWYESDMFDGEFATLLISMFVEARPFSKPTYYEWLVSKKEEKT